MTKTALRDPATAKALTTAGRNVAKWTAERDRLIRLAVEQGSSLREVGAAAGLSHTAVRFIAHGRGNAKSAPSRQAGGAIRGGS